MDIASETITGVTPYTVNVMGITTEMCRVTVFKIRKDDSMSETLSPYYVCTDLYQLLRSFISPFVELFARIKMTGLLLCIILLISMFSD